MADPLSFGSERRPEFRGRPLHTDTAVPSGHLAGLSVPLPGAGAKGVRLKSRAILKGKRARSSPTGSEQIPVDVLCLAAAPRSQQAPRVTKLGPGKQRCRDTVGVHRDQVLHVGAASTASLGDTVARASVAVPGA